MNKIHPYTYVGIVEIPKTTFSINPIDAFNEMVDLCSKIFGISENNILGRSRKRPYVVARQIIAYILRKKYNLTLSRIGKLMNRDHSTIVHNLECHKNDYETNDWYARKANFIIKQYVKD